MEYARTIAMDGPAGSGKSTVGTKLAERLGYVFVDTGLLYRGITRRVLDEGIDTQDISAIAEVAHRLTDHFQTADRAYHDLLQTAAGLHDADVGKAVPVVAAYPAVRAQVRQIQREIARHGCVIFAGRDIGTVVLPDADLKIFLDASLTQRAKRRYDYFRGQNQERTFAQILSDLGARDALDSHRAESPLRIADDAHIIYTDNMSVSQVLDTILLMIAEYEA